MNDLELIYRGLCLGGPLDGKLIDHYAPYYRVAEMNMMVLQRVPESALLEKDAFMNTFVYKHFTALDFIFWLPEQVFKNERYNHKIYRCPEEYIFDKLTANYRPEGR